MMEMTNAHPRPDQYLMHILLLISRTECAKVSALPAGINRTTFETKIEITYET
jgi:hypothetical protein